MSEPRRLALRHPRRRLVVAACLCAGFAPGAAAAAVGPDPSPPAAGPRPDAAPSARALAQPAPRTTTAAPVRRVVVVPAAPRVVRVATSPPTRTTPAVTPRPRTAPPKPARVARAKPKPAPAPAPAPARRTVPIAGESREAIARAVVAARETDPVPLLLAAAGLAGMALAGGGLAVALGRELRAL